MFDPKEFIQSPSLEWLEKLKKVELLDVAKELELEVKKSMRKYEIKKIIVEMLVDDDVLPDESLQQYPTMSLDSSEQAELKRLEYEHEFRMRQLQKEEREREKELEIKKEIEIKKEEREIKEFEFRTKQLELQKASEESKANKFDISKHVRLVPPFNEAEIDKYFQHFEKVAVNLKWPKAMWPLLLQSVLKGKAQEAYSALSVTDCSDYDTVKASILRAYELVPEAYRQKFRHYRKQDNQTYVECAHEKQVYYDRWCHSKEIKGS